MVDKAKIQYHNTHLMNSEFYNELAKKSIDGIELDDKVCQQILADKSIELLPLLNAAFAVR